ncbi:endonuclease/exonuclease/phosphatase family protein [soil metagenome]
MRLRVVSYNVHSFRAGWRDVAAALSALEPDLVLLQECGSRRTLLRVASLLGAGVASTAPRFPWFVPFGGIRNAVLYPATWRASNVESSVLSREGRSRPRGFVAARLRHEGVRLTVISAHLGLAATERARHARELTDALASWHGNLILGIDLNEESGAPAGRWVAERLYDAFANAGDGSGGTFPARVPTARIDYVFVGEGVTVERCWVPPDPEFGSVSDHRPVAADVEVEDA